MGERTGAFVSVSGVFGAQRAVPLPLPDSLRARSITPQLSSLDGNVTMVLVTFASWVLGLCRMRNTIFFLMNLGTLH